MSKKKTKKSANPIIWVIQTFAHIIWLILDLIYRIFRNLCCCCCFCVSGTFFSLILVALMLYGISANHQSYFDGIDNGISSFNTNIVTLAASVDNCAPMTNKLTILYNFVVKMIYALVNAITDGLGITYQGNPIFQWARQSVTIRYRTKQHNIEKARNDYIESAIHTYGVESLTDLSYGHQLNIRKGAEKAAFMASQSLPAVDIGTLCGILDSIFGWLISLLNLFNVFFVQIFGKIITALLKFINNNGSLPDVLVIFIKFILDLLLNEIPFAKCLRTPLALVGCMCTPKNSNLITSIDVWLVGCAFSTCDASQYSSGFVAIQYCIGLRAALDQLGIFGTAVSALLDAIDYLVVLIDHVDDLINILEDAVNHLLDVVGAKLEVLEDNQRVLHEKIKTKVSESKKNSQQFTGSSTRHFISQLNQHANNLPLYKHVPRSPFNATEQAEINAHNADVERFKNMSNTPLFNPEFSFDTWIQQYDYENHPIYGMMYDVNSFIKSSSPVGENFLNLSAIGYQVFTNSLDMLMGKEDLTIEQMVQRYSIIPFHTVPYHFDRIFKHMELIQHNITHNCFIDCVNCTQEALDLCNKTESWIQYLDRTREDWKQSLMMLDPITPTTMTNQSQEELQKAFEAGEQLHQQRYTDFLEYKRKNNIHASAINLSFQLQGQLAFIFLGASAVGALTCSNICASCCNGSFNICSVLTGCCPLILVLLGTVLGTLLLNFFKGTNDPNDLVSPFMQQLDWLNIYHETPSPIEIQNQIVTANGLLMNMINRVGIKVISWALKITVFGIPIIVLPEPEDTDTVIDWALSIIFNDYFANCVTSADCIHTGKCYRIRDIHNLDAFCTKECVEGDDCSDVNGKCYRAPFIRPGICASEIIPNFGVTIQPQCGNKNISSFPVISLIYTNQTDFMNNGGWSREYLKSSGFRSLLYNLAATSVYWSLFWLRLITEGFQISPHGIFFTLIHNMPISIPGLDYMTPITMANYFIFPTLKTISLDTHDIVASIPFEPFITLETAWKFNNHDEFPPLGKSIAAMWTCEIIYTPQAILGLFVLGVFAVIIYTILFAPLAIFTYYALFKFSWFLLRKSGKKVSSFVSRKSANKKR